MVEYKTFNVMVCSGHGTRKHFIDVSAASFEDIETVLSIYFTPRGDWFVFIDENGFEWNVELDEIE